MLRRRAQYLSETMKEVCGFDPTEETRRRDVVMARIMVVYVLLLEGWSENQIGSVMGWDHSTINYYRKRMIAILTTPGYNAEIDIWEKFRQTI